MAMINFTDAILHIPANANPIDYVKVTLDYSLLTDSNNEIISDNGACDILTATPKNLVLSYSGKFTANGTEFYFGPGSGSANKWKMTGISFQSGDTYNFQIPVTLTCL